MLLGNIKIASQLGSAQTKHSASLGMREKKVFVPLLTGVYELQEPRGKRKFLSDPWAAPAGQSEVTRDFILSLTFSCRFQRQPGSSGVAGAGIETVIGTFSRERCKLPLSSLTRKSCASNAEAGVFGKGPGSGHTHERLFELCQERGERTHSLQRSLLRSLICIFKKGDANDPLPLLMRCVHVDTAAIPIFHLHRRTVWCHPQCRSAYGGMLRNKGDTHLCLTASARDVSRKDLCCGAETLIRCVAD